MTGVLIVVLGLVAMAAKLVRRPWHRWRRQKQLPAVRRCGFEGTKASAGKLPGLSAVPVLGARLHPMAAEFDPNDYDPEVIAQAHVASAAHDFLPRCRLRR
jgi:hypothetical protein